MPVQVIAAAAAGEPRRRRQAHLCSSHPLFEVARQHCDRHGRRRYARPCEVCWETAIRDDERVAVEYGLPREIVVDPLYVDEIAVEKACKGEQVALTPVERAEAIRRLADKGMRRRRSLSCCTCPRVIWLRCCRVRRGAGPGARWRCCTAGRGRWRDER